MMVVQHKKYQYATATAILFHGTGLAGILWGNTDYFAHLTWLNMGVVMALLVWTQDQKRPSFCYFILFVFGAGILLEYIGSSTGMLFGAYYYGTALGYSINGVPLVIGINWFIVVYCCSTTMYMLNKKLLNGLPGWQRWSAIVDAAFLAVLFDWILEPVAVGLGYWYWESNTIPFYNYVCWFAISLGFNIVFSFIRIPKSNRFAVHLLMIEVLFFLILRMFL